MTHFIYKSLMVLTSLVIPFTISTYSHFSTIYAQENSIDMYRLYNPNSGEHFYTSDKGEKKYLTSIGWNDEGIAWSNPTSSNTPIYRLYNQNAGDHHYTADSVEKKNLIRLGWKDEGIGWYANDDKKNGLAVWREYNPHAQSGSHNYTTNKEEHNLLVSMGWKDEGVAWYAVSPTVSLWSMPTISNEDFSLYSFKDTSLLVDAYGNKFGKDNYRAVYANRDHALDPSSVHKYREFRVTGYSHLSGRLGVVYSMSANDVSVDFRITGDGKTLFSSNGINLYSHPIKFDVDISDIALLRLEFDEGHDWREFVVVFDQMILS